MVSSSAKHLAVTLLAASLVGFAAAIGAGVSAGGLSASVAVGSGAGDPVMVDFEGRAFEFVGEVGRHYNVISETNQQVSMKLKLGQMWDHNGTYIEGIGFRYQDHKVVVELMPNDAMHVYLDGKLLQMGQDEFEQEQILALEKGEMMLLWQLHCPNMGNAVEITTDLLNVVVFLTPAGTRDEGGFLQPAYLNFDAALLEPPTGELKGIVGEGYGRLTSPRAAAAPAAADFKFHGDPADYVLDDYFSAPAGGGAALAHASSRGFGGYRRLIERVDIEFPLRFRTGRRA